MCCFYQWEAVMMVLTPKMKRSTGPITLKGYVLDILCPFKEHLIICCCGLKDDDFNYCISTD